MTIAVDLGRKATRQTSKRHNCLVSDMYGGQAPHNQTCVMVNMSDDPVAMMPGLLVGRK